MARKPTTIHLHSQAIATMQAAMQVIASKEAELQMLRLGLERLIEQHSGVNLTAENWNLDTDHWTLTKEQ